MRHAMLTDNWSYLLASAELLIPLKQPPRLPLSRLPLIATRYSYQQSTFSIGGFSGDVAYLTRYFGIKIAHRIAHRIVHRIYFSCVKLARVLSARLIRRVIERLKRDRGRRGGGRGGKLTRDVE